MDFTRWKQASSAGLRAERCRRKMTQAQLAEQIGVSQGTVSNWEAGDTPIPLYTAMELAAQWGITLDQLAGRTGDLYGYEKAV